MKRPGKEEQTFREWLVYQVKLSRHSNMGNETIPARAERLGVREDVLIEAMHARATETEAQAKVPRRIIERRMVKVWMPAEVYADWDKYCEIISVTGGALLRSMVNHFLLHPIPTPAMLLKRWVYRGKKYKTSRATRKRVYCRVPRGAQQAIDHHARTLRCSTDALIRGLVLDVLEGRMRQFRVVMIDEMWGDPKRYLHPELFR